MKYTIIIEKGRESGYVAHAPVLKGCVSQGKTKEKALKNSGARVQKHMEKVKLPLRNKPTAKLGRSVPDQLSI